MIRLGGGGGMDVHLGSSAGVQTSIPVVGNTTTSSFCSSCGVRLAQGVKFCNSCGALIRSGEPQLMAHVHSQGVVVPQPFVLTQPAANDSYLPQPFVVTQPAASDSYIPML